MFFTLFVITHANILDFDVCKLYNYNSSTKQNILLPLSKV
jgi:hypothetical protein